MTLDVAMFTGGRGGRTIARELLRTPGVRLTLIVNGYDNGHSTGALRRYLPGMLGPSDFRKNLLLHLGPDDPRTFLLEHRLPAGTTRADLAALVTEIAESPAAHGPRGFASLGAWTRDRIAADLRAFLARSEHTPFELADCALGNLVLAGAYLRCGEDFNAAIQRCAESFGTPVRLLNVTGGENAYLTAVKADGRVLADEADIVAPQDPVPLVDLFLLREPQTGEPGTGSAEQARTLLADRAAAVTANPAALAALRSADLVVYGPGTPHSSLLPSYLTPGVADALTGGRSVARVLVVNTRSDHDIQGLDAPELVSRALTYLGDPRNERRTVTHVLCHRPQAPATDVPAVPQTLMELGECLGAHWLTADLEAPGRAGVHDGPRTVAVLPGLVDAVPAGVE